MFFPTPVFFVKRAKNIAMGGGIRFDKLSRRRKVGYVSSARPFGASDWSAINLFIILVLFGPGPLETYEKKVGQNSVIKK